MQVVINSLLVNYKIKGNGKKTILFMHGWGDSLQTFKKVVDGLSKKYTVISVDLPGFGASQRPLDSWGLEDYSNFVNNFLEKINKPDPYAIVGHSNGGAVAIKGLSNGHLKTNKLILLASAGVRCTKEQSIHRVIWNVIAKIGKAFTIFLPRSTKQALRRRLYNTAGSDLLVVESMEGTFRKVVGADVLEDAKNIDLPALLLYGSKDNITPPEYGQAISESIKNSKLEIIPDAGHFVHLDEFQLIAQKINEFLK